MSIIVFCKKLASKGSLEKDRSIFCVVIASIIWKPNLREVFIVANGFS